jgi:hypothetical protein
VKLNQTAQEALDNVEVKQLALKTAKANFEEELRQELERKLEPYVNDRDLAVKLADQSGVPRTHIGRALGTSNYKTIQEILERFGISPRSQSEAIPNKLWSCVKTQDGWKLSISNLGPAGLTGSAIVAIDQDGSLERVDGDYFVVGAIYTQGLADEVIECMR